MSKQKLTRKSYKRNIIVFGLMLFMGIALVSTGFATWILSHDATITASGNVEVGIVSDEAMEIELVSVSTRNRTFDTVSTSNGHKTWRELSTDENNKEYAYDASSQKITGFNFMFEPLKGDEDGEIQYDSENAKSYEQLSLKIVGKITKNFEHVDHINVSFSNTEAKQIAAINGLIAAFENGYITLPEEYFDIKDDLNDDGTQKYFGDTDIKMQVCTGIKTLTLSLIDTTKNYSDLSGFYYEKDSEGNNSAMCFQIVIEFGWSKLMFDEENPSYSLDKNNVEYQVKYDRLVNLRSLIGTGYLGKYDDTVDVDTDGNVTSKLDLQYAINIDIKTEPEN